jgi:hypothetical protein
MTTEKYKCIKQPKNIFFSFTIGKEYEFKIEELYISTLDDNSNNVYLTERSLNLAFQKVEPTTQPMRYKVTITTQDSTGHEDTIVFNDVTENLLTQTIGKGENQRTLIEPMPEKQKVKVWFYVYTIEGFPHYSVSNSSKEKLEPSYKDIISRGFKVSQIQSMDVEI